MNNEMDYARFHNLESYLFESVGPQFRESQRISPTDFYILLSWKANRSKNKGRDRLVRLGGDFQSAVKSIASSLASAHDQKARLRCLMVDWGFRLPIASAILAVLYPDEFTVYDVRVSGELNDFKRLGGRSYSDRLWSDYEKFRDAVSLAVPQKNSLREKDHYLWGRSFYRGIKKDCAA